MADSSKLEGIVENITFRNEDNGFTVLDLSAGRDFVTCVGIFPEICEGEEVVLYGTWTEHPTFGRQFKVESYESKFPENSTQLLRYLSSGIIHGVGKKTAVKIIEEFGNDAFDILQNHPERLCVIKGITRSKADKISEEFNRQFAIRTVMAGLEPYGIKPIEAVNIFKQFGGNALTTIHLNPYILCGTVRGFDFYRCDKIAHQMPDEIDPEKRNFAAILYFLRYNYNNGHTCIPVDKTIPTLMQLLEVSESEAQQTMDIAVNSKQARIFNIDGRDFIATAESYNAELSAAEKLNMMAKFPAADLSAIENDLIKIEDADNVHYEDKQKLAIINATAKGILILTGGPGTGKTTTVKGMISLFRSYDMKISLAAPTGRAAKRMSEVTGMEAKTIHRLLEAEWGDDEKSVFAKNMQNPLDADVVIVDEMSMVDIFLFNSLVDALRLGTRLILVGDSDQLPSVGPGNVLGDLISSGLFPVVQLTEIFRQARSSLIVTNAHKIVSGEKPTLDDKQSDFFFMPRANAIFTAETIGELCSKRLPETYDYNPIDDIQVLCPSKKGDCGSINLNTRLQALLNPPSTSKQEYKLISRVFRVGDKVMQVRNNYDLEWVKGDEDGTGIFNGDVGRLKKISHAEKTMTIDFDGRIAHYPMDKLEDLDLAYAVTIHKSQGSEFPAVIIPVIDAPERLMYRNLIYTGITRAKNILIIIGNRDKLNQMIQNDKIIKRYSALRTFLIESAGKEITL